MIMDKCELYSSFFLFFLSFFLERVAIICAPTSHSIPFGITCIMDAVFF